MNYSTTNIFCIIANIGSDQELYMKHILDHKYFSRTFKLGRLVYNTTKPINKNDDEYKVNRYKHFTIEEIQSIPRDDLVDYRSYYTIPYNDVVYFTFRSDIEDKNNLICIVSPYQYENYKRWTAMENFKYPDRYRLYAILLHCSAKTRFYNKLKTVEDFDDMDLLEFCRRVLQDNNEYNDVKDRLPEFKDPMNCNNVCYIDCEDSSDDSFKTNLAQIKGFIADKIKSD